jgi:hypothetical protein
VRRSLVLRDRIANLPSDGDGHAEIRFSDRRTESASCLRLFLFALTSTALPEYLESRESHFVFAFRGALG